MMTSVSDLAWRCRAVTRGGGLRVSKMGKLQNKGKLSKFYVYSGNEDGSDCGSAHCSWCMVKSISVNTAC